MRAHDARVWGEFPAWLVKQRPIVVEDFDARDPVTKVEIFEQNCIYFGVSIFGTTSVEFDDPFCLACEEIRGGKRKRQGHSGDKYGSAFQSLIPMQEPGRQSKTINLMI